MEKEVIESAHKEEVNDSVGPKVQQFYLCYRDAESTDYHDDLMESLYHLEHHTPCNASGETVEVILEIVSDCQKKVAQLIRAPYADSVRGMISSIRKKLLAKVQVSVDADSSSQHGQRHLNSLLELLGTWSNMIDRIRSTHWYINLFTLIILLFLFPFVF
jgi:hypothetical protein